ncbi:hypothetical protein ID866_12697 [Astraeus odoratus]|nr:hypothetical protein ID866_12697 [Astraeus odoratus]
MFGKFWLNIQSHPWCTSTDPFAKKALLSYQAKQHHIWHYSIGTPLANPLTAGTKCPQAPTTMLPGNPSDSLDKCPRFCPSSPSRAFLPATPSTDSTPPPVLSVCPICLSWEKHKIIKCNASLTWDKQFKTICKHFNKLLLTCANDQAVCAKWQ